MVTNEKLSKAILKDYPRMSRDDKFTFECHPGVPCFNKCCSDVNIFLTPYDIVKLKNKINMSSGDFLEKYTILPIEEHLRHPIVMLKMDDETYNCPFLAENGCSVYDSRPWACRMYPVGMASPGELNESDDKGFYFLLKEEVCRGYEEKKEWTIEEWMNTQGAEEYNEMGDLFKEVSLHEHFLKGKPVEPVKLEMFYMVCYDVDKFRDFIFSSTFFKRFDIEHELKEKLLVNDSELLKFGFKWLRFSLFGENTLKIQDEYMQVVD